MVMFKTRKNKHTLDILSVIYILVLPKQHVSILEIYTISFHIIYIMFILYCTLFIQIMECYNIIKVVYPVRRAIMVSFCLLYHCICAISRYLCTQEYKCYCVQVQVVFEIIVPCFTIKFKKNHN